MKPWRVLVPVDFGGASLAAVCYAQEIAQLARSQVFLLHVIEPVDAARRERQAAGTTPRDRRLNAYYNLASVIAECGLNPFQVTAVVRRGTPVEVIIDYADEIGADFIVMGPQVRSEPQRS